MQCYTSCVGLFHAMLYSKQNACNLIDPFTLVIVPCPNICEYFLQPLSWEPLVEILGQHISSWLMAHPQLRPQSNPHAWQHSSVIQQVRGPTMSNINVANDHRTTRQTSKTNLTKRKCKSQWSMRRLPILNNERACQHARALG